MAPYESLGGPSPFWKWLSTVDPVTKRLAWCHTTDAFRLRKIVTDGAFSLSHCDVFNEDLLYFFYGRPAFRRGESEQVRLSSRAPVAVILSPDLIDRGRRLFPFDSGAFSGHYSQWMHHGMQLADFELACPGDAPQRSVAAFFGTNADYLRAIPSQPPKPYQGEFEVESVVELLKDPRSAEADDRRLAIELQVGRQVAFDATSVLALIVPDELVQAAWFDSFVSGPGTGVEVATYQMMLLRRAGDYQALLEERAQTIQEARGLT